MTECVYVLQCMLMFLFVFLKNTFFVITIIIKNKITHEWNACMCFNFAC